MNKEIIAIYFSGLIQGIALVAFPAASTLFTDPNAFNFSASMYGSLFIPQAILSILFSLFSMKMNKWWGAKIVFFLGIISNLISMVLLSTSALVMHEAIAYPFLLLATGFLGIGFGLTVPTLNTMAALIYPFDVNSTILKLNALLGLGTALSPILIALFVHLHAWWGLPVILAIAMIVLLVFTVPLDLPGGKVPKNQREKTLLIPNRFWLFACAALLYGICETLNGNWSLLYMKTFEEATFAMQSLALFAFWGMVTIGRIGFAFIERKFTAQMIYRILPLVVILAFIVLGLVPDVNENLAILSFALAGLGCSALLPLIISLASEQFISIVSTVAGVIVAFYLIGYGIAAFGTGFLIDTAHLNLRGIYFIGMLVAILLLGINFATTKKSKIEIEEKI